MAWILPPSGLPGKQGGDRAPTPRPGPTRFLKCLDASPALPDQAGPKTTSPRVYCRHLVLIGAMNPRPRGYYGDPVQECTCSNATVSRYQAGKRHLTAAFYPPDLGTIAGLDRYPHRGAAGRGDSARRLQESLEKLSDDRLGEMRDYCRLDDAPPAFPSRPRPTPGRCRERGEGSWVSVGLYGRGGRASKEGGGLLPASGGAGCSVSRTTTPAMERTGPATLL